MTRKILATTILAGGTALLALGAAQADGRVRQRADVPPRSEWMSIADLSAKLESQGYRIDEIEAEHGAYEVEMTDAKGMQVEAYLDPVTGEPIRKGREDD